MPESGKRIVDGTTQVNKKKVPKKK